MSGDPCPTRPRRASVAALAAALAVILTGLLGLPGCTVAASPQNATPAQGSGSVAVAAAGTQQPAAAGQIAPPGSSPATTVVAGAHRPRVGIYGDSTALMSAFGILAWLERTGKGVASDGFVGLGCGIVRGGIRRDNAGQGPNVPECEHWEVTFRQKIEAAPSDLVVVEAGPWDVIDHLLPGDTKWRGPLDPVYDRKLFDEMLGITDLLSSGGALVVWLTLPLQLAEVGKNPYDTKGPGADPARAQRFNDLMRRLPEQRPGKAAVVDFAGWLAASGDDRRLRPDGIHVSFDTTNEVAERFLGPALIDAFESARGNG